MKNKSLIILFSTYFIILNSIFISATTQEECNMGGGKWTTPDISSPGEPSKKELIPYCSCPTGFFWDDSLNLCKDDSELRCIQTQGKWIDNKCQCPEKTIKWTPGFGCDIAGPVPSGENIKTESNLESKNNFYIYLLLSLILLILSLFIYLAKRGWKR